MINILINNRYMLICVVTVFFIAIYMGNTEEKRSLRDIAIYDTVSVEEYKLLLKEHLKEFSFCKCLSYGFKGYNLRLEDESEGVFYDLEDPNWFYKELTILDSCSKIVADSIPVLEHFYEEHRITRRLIFIGCIDYYHSDKLDSLVNQLIEESEELNNEK